MAGTLDLPTLVQKVRVDADTKGAETQVSNSASRIGSTMQKAGVAASVGLSVPIIAGAYKATQAASDLAESASKVGVVFESQAPQVRKFAESAATDLGMSEQAALEATGTFGNLFRALDIGTKPAADMSTALVTLAADLASFNNANPEDVLLALRSGLLGEAEPLRQFGVSLSAARIEAEALATGLVKPIANATKVAEAALSVEAANRAAAAALKEHGSGSLEYQQAALKATKAEEAYAAATAGSVPELTAAQKAQAAYAIIQKDTALAQGDFARTSDGLANQQRILTAQFKDAQAELGQGLLPVGIKVVGMVNSLLSGFKGLSPEGKKVVTIVAGIAAAIGPVLIVAGKLATAFSALRAVFAAQAVAATASASATGAAGAAATPLLATLLPLIAAVAAVAAAGYLIYRNWGKIAPILKAVGSAFSRFWTALTTGFTQDEGGTWFEDLGLKINSFRETIADVVSFLTTHVVPHFLEFGTKVVEAVGTAFTFLKEEVLPIVTEFAAFLITKVQELQTWWNGIWPQFREAVDHVFRAVRTVIETALGILKPLIEGALGAIAAFWRAWGDDIVGFVSTAVGVVQEVISGALQVIQGIIQTVLAVINGDWGKAWEGIVGIVSGAWDAIFGIFRGAVDIVRGLLGGIVSTMGEVLRPVGNFLHTWIVEPFEEVIGFIARIPGRIADLASGMFDGIRDAFRDAINFIIRGWNSLEFTIPGFNPPGPGPSIPGFTLGVPDIKELALGGRTIPGEPFLAGHGGVELVTGQGGSAQVLNAERTQRLLRQIADGRGSVSPEPGIYAPIQVETVDRRSGEALGRDIAWGLSSGTGRPLVGASGER